MVCASECCLAEATAGKLVQVKWGMLGWRCGHGAAGAGQGWSQSGLFLLPVWLCAHLHLCADVDSDFPSLSLAGCTQLLNELQVPLSFLPGLAGQHHPTNPSIPSLRVRLWGPPQESLWAPLPTSVIKLLAALSNCQPSGRWALCLAWSKCYFALGHFHLLFVS